MQVSTIGLDIAKSLFQVHGVGQGGKVVLRKRLGRARVLAFFANLPRCLIGLEACGGAHYWARELQALGHEVRLMPPQYVPKKLTYFRRLFFYERLLSVAGCAERAPEGRLDGAKTGGIAWFICYDSRRSSLRSWRPAWAWSRA